MTVPPVREGAGSGREGGGGAGGRGEPAPQLV